MLKNLYLLTISLLFLLSLSSCEKINLEPADQPVVDIEYFSLFDTEGLFMSEGVIPVDHEAHFRNRSANLSECQWDFGNGQTSKEDYPSVKYKVPGTYTVRFQGKDREGRIHTWEKVVVVKEQFLKVISISGFDWDLGFPLPAGWDVSQPTDVVLEIWSVDKTQSIWRDSEIIGEMVYQSPVLKGVQGTQGYDIGVSERIPLSIEGLGDRHVIVLRALQGDSSVIFFSNDFRRSASGVFGAIERFEWHSLLGSNRVILYTAMEK